MSFSLVARLGRLASSAVLLAAMLGGCGGGGGSDAGPEVGKNGAPVVTMLLSGSVSAGGASADVTAGAGSDLILSATGSTDPDGDTLTYKWSIVTKPEGSNIALVNETSSQQTVRGDIGGDYVFRLRVTDAKGAYAEKDARVKILPNRAPVSNVVVVISPNLTEAASGATTINTSTGYMVALDGASSSDPDGNTLTYAWSVVSKPAASQAALSGSTGAASQITPDLLGTYQVKLTVTDTLGSSHSYITTIVVANRRPLANIASNATAVALPTGPAVRMPLGTLLTLRGTSSSDADGDTLVYGWSLVSKPADSAATLSSATDATVQLTPDASGSYVVRMRVTDSAGAFSERTLTVEAGNYSPVAVLDKQQVTTLTGTAVNASAALSYDNDGDTLSYAWTLDARPAGSALSLASTASSVALTPDVPGVYMATVTVTDGKSSSVASFYIKALASVATNVSLNFAPLEARYSKGLDKMIVVAANPNALKIVDPFTGVIKTVALPMAVKSIQLSPDGKLAAVLHENILSLVDLEAAVLIRSSSTGGSHTDAFVRNNGMTYLVGQSGGQWVDVKVTVIDGRTGVNYTSTLASNMAYGQGRFYGTQYGIYAPLKNRVLLMSQGLSPADIDFFAIDGTSGAVTSSGESPYHGDYAMSTPLFLSESEDLLFTSAGTYFNSETLRYAGSLATVNNVLSMSHSGQADEALVMSAEYAYYGGYTYVNAYKRFTGALFLPAASITLPVINAEQSYGLKIFHSANMSHVALVQTGTAVQNGTGVKYFVTTR